MPFFTLNILSFGKISRSRYASYLYENVKITNFCSNKNILKMHLYNFWTTCVCPALAWGAQSPSPVNVEELRPELCKTQQTTKFPFKPHPKVLYGTARFKTGKKKEKLKCSGSLLEDYERTKKCLMKRKKSKNPFSLFILLVDKQNMDCLTFTHISIWTQPVQVQQQVSARSAWVNPRGYLLIPNPLLQSMFYFCSH